MDWGHPEKNDFALAEEVTLRGGYERRPDLVLYLNGIAIGVIELKRSSVEVADGVRQLITNQEEIFNKGFFSTVQFVFAGSDSQGLRYGTTGTPEKYFVEWKAARDDASALEAGALLDRPLAEMCNKPRLLDLIRNFVIFDAGQKKVPRQHQFIGVTKAQERIRQREGGVIWHTQGSGKSILMVLIAKWLLEHDPEARVLIVTDRDELDKQIEGVMKNAGVVGENSPSPRITSRAEFVAKLSDTTPRLLCALVHKFDPADLNRIETERRVAYTAPDAFAPGGKSEVYFGTLDALVIHPPGNLADLCDYKSGADDRDHRAQLAGYALALFSERTRLKTIRCHVLYGRTRRADSWSLTQADAAGIVHPILEARQKPDRTPAACDYCTFCLHRATCPAITGQVEAVARTAPTWEDLAPAIRDPAAITDATLAAKALTVARFVSTWADAIRARATELARSGAILPGYRLQERRGAREITDLDAAFTRTGLTPGQFVSACKLSLPKLGDAFATARGLSKAAAGREIESTLADLIREGTPTVSLVADRKGEV